MVRLLFIAVQVGPTDQNDAVSPTFIYTNDGGRGANDTTNERRIRMSKEIRLKFEPIFAYCVVMAQMKAKNATLTDVSIYVLQS